MSWLCCGQDVTLPNCEEFYLLCFGRWYEWQSENTNPFNLLTDSRHYSAWKLFYAWQIIGTTVPGDLRIFNDIRENVNQSENTWFRDYNYHFFPFHRQIDSIWDLLFVFFFFKAIRDTMFKISTQSSWLLFCKSLLLGTFECRCLIVGELYYLYCWLSWKYKLWSLQKCIVFYHYLYVLGGRIFLKKKIIIK